MPLGEGWWISPDGQIYSVSEHLEFIKRHPEFFGFTVNEAKSFSEKDRDRVLIDVMKKGWVRVRDTGGGRGISVEVWDLSPEVRFHVIKFLENTLYFSNEDKLKLSELSRKFYNWVDLFSLKRGRLYLFAKRLFFQIISVLQKRKKILSLLETGFKGRFVIHDHRAQQHHWDLRLEWPVQKELRDKINDILLSEWGKKKIDKNLVRTKNKKSVFRSWAIPKHRLPNQVNEKIMLSETELHSIEYGDFEGEIPAGFYGAGEVEIYDKGVYEVLKYDKKEDNLVFWLKGKKINDIFSIVSAFKDKNQWLLIKLDKRKWAIKSFTNWIQNWIIKSLKKPLREEDIKKLDDKELAFDHALTHRGINLLNQKKKFGDWSKKELEQIHDILVAEAGERELAWGQNHKTPIKD